MLKYLALSMVVVAMTGCALDDSDDVADDTEATPAPAAAPAPAPPPVTTSVRPMLKTRH
jgi:hypothetical protein